MHNRCRDVAVDKTLSKCTEKLADSLSRESAWDLVQDGLEDAYGKQVKAGRCPAVNGS
jgi:hypothetical protein